MKKFLFGCTIALIGLTTPAFADYCCPPPPCCEPVCCATDFNGFYVGGNVGVFSNTAHRNDFDGFLLGRGRNTIDTNVTAGVLVGYDMECCNKLVGVVADWNWVNSERRNHSSSDDSANRDRFDWFTTIRARAGMTVCDALVYVTMGAAVARFDVRWTGTAVDDVVPSFRHRHTRWGWVGGVGTEFLLGCNWSLGAEILMLNFSERTRSYSFTSGGTAPVTSTFRLGHSDTAFVGRVILNWRIGSLFGF